MSSKNTVEIRVLSDLTGNDKTVYIWTARLPMTEVSVTTICINCSTVICFFKKQQILQHLRQENEKKGKESQTGHKISLEIAEKLKHKGINVTPGMKLCRNCNQKTKDLADEQVDINECDNSNVNEFATSLQIVEQRHMLNESFRIIDISPLKIHAVTKTTKIKAARDKLE